MPHASYGVVRLDQPKRRNDDEEKTMLKIHIYRDRKGEHRLSLRARNGRIIADSAEGYKRHSGALLAADWIVVQIQAGYVCIVDDEQKR
jgi:uncharacterized protein YegP (UPF0339 family)